MPESIINKSKWLIIPLLFLIYSAPSALDYVFHFPDEKYYTDAVLQMMDKDDYFTPYKADGTPRFLKPIATYWVLIGSYKLLGVSKLSSRLLFWLAGALLVTVVFFMAYSITKNRKTAITSAFITASNPLVLLSASRSIPDILLVLFITISAWGFLEILINKKSVAKYYWMAYMGAALAFETKGLPAAAFAGVSILFLLFNPWIKKKAGELIHFPAIIASAILALSWFAIMYFEHGTSYLSSFYTDQVGERISSKTWQVISNTSLGILNLVAFSLPWIIITLSKPKKIIRLISSSDKNIKAVLGFTATWVIAIIIMSGAVFKFYDRYILPVIPLISIFYAWSLNQYEARFKETILRIFLVLNLVILAINLLYAGFILPDKILVAGIILTSTIISAYFLGIFKNITTEIYLANGVMLLYFNGFILLYPLLMPNPGEQLVTTLKSKGITEKHKVYVYGNIRTASNIRIHSHNEFNVISMDTVYTLPKEDNHFLVYDEKEKDLLNLKGYEIYDGSEEWQGVSAYAFPEFLQKPVQKLKDNGTHYLIALPGKNQTK